MFSILIKLEQLRAQDISSQTEWGWGIWSEWQWWTEQIRRRRWTSSREERPQVWNWLWLVVYYKWCRQRRIRGVPCLEEATRPEDYSEESIKQKRWATMR